MEGTTEDEEVELTATACFEAATEEEVENVDLETAIEEEEEEAVELKQATADKEMVETAHVEMTTEEEVERRATAGLEATAEMATADLEVTTDAHLKATADEEEVELSVNAGVKARRRGQLAD